MPVSVRDVIDAPSSTLGPSSQASHVGFGPGFIEENEAVQVKRRLKLAPPHAGLFYIGSILLAGP